MKDDEKFDCDRHGSQPITFVCKHIAEASPGVTVGFVSGEPDDKDDLRDAWCDQCDVFLRAHGGEWRDGSVEPPQGGGILCAQCYRLKEAEAERADRRVIHRGC